MTAIDQVDGMASFRRQHPTNGLFFAKGSLLKVFHRARTVSAPSDNVPKCCQTELGALLSDWTPSRLQDSGCCREIPPGKRAPRFFDSQAAPALGPGQGAVPRTGLGRLQGRRRGEDYWVDEGEGSLGALVVGSGQPGPTQHERNRVDPSRRVVDPIRLYGPRTTEGDREYDDALGPGPTTTTDRKDVGRHRHEDRLGQSDEVVWSC